MVGEDVNATVELIWRGTRAAPAHRLRDTAHQLASQAFAAHNRGLPWGTREAVTERRQRRAEPAR